MAFAIKGQTKATAAFKDNFGVYGPILFKVCVKVAYFSPRKTCSMAFTMKGQTKASAGASGTPVSPGQPPLMNGGHKHGLYIERTKKGRSGIFLWEQRSISKMDNVPSEPERVAGGANRRTLQAQYNIRLRSINLQY